MDFGMPTLIETNNIGECVSLCKKLGLSFIELNMNLPQYQLDTIHLKQLKRLMAENHIYYTIHIDENCNPCDFNSKVANAYIETVLSTIILAKELDVPLLNMHMSNGVYFTLPTKKVYLFEHYEDIYLDKIRTFQTVCEKAIGNGDLRICIENTSWYGKPFLHKAIEQLLSSHVFALTYDIGHDHSAGGHDCAFIGEHADKLYHMHAHDALGKKHHLALGSGEINISKKLELARQCSCRVVLETKTLSALRESVAYLPCCNL